MSCEHGMVGSIGNIYDSIQNLHESYVLPHHTKDSLLKPNFRPCDCSVPMLQLRNEFYDCCTCSSDSGLFCPFCCRKINMSVPTLDIVGKNTAGEGGIVKGVVTYMVMDDLVVTPMSTILCITLLNRFNVGDVSALQEKTVNLRYSEAVKLLKASLHSKNVLTDVFLTKKNIPYNC